MTGKTHQAFNLVVTVSIFAMGIIDMHSITVNDAVAIGGIIAGGALPDLDSPNSSIRHRIRRLIIPKGYRQFSSKMAMSSAGFGHRKNCTHWPVFWLSLCAILYICLIAAQPWKFFFMGLSIGTTAHLFCDMLNPYGIMIFAPLSRKRFNIAKIKTNSISEMAFLFVLISTAFVMMAYAFQNT